MAEQRRVAELRRMDLALEGVNLLLDGVDLALKRVGLVRCCIIAEK